MDATNEHFIDLTVLDLHGEEVGTVTDIIADAETLAPEYLTVRTGLRDKLSGDHLVPVAIVDRAGEDLVVTCDRDVVQHAPRSREHLPPTASEREEIAAHYGA